MTLRLTTLLTAALMATSGSVFAADDAGSIIKRLQDRLVPSLPAQVPPRAQPAIRELADVPGLKVQVDRFVIEGNELLTDAELIGLLTDYLARPVGVRELRQASDQVGSAYRQAGWVARVFLPAQDITGGMVRIRVIEGRRGALTVASSDPVLVPELRIRGLLDAAVVPGQPINLNELDRAQLLISDLPGVTASTALSAGANDGTTDVTVELTPSPRYAGAITLDNTGSRSTGSERLALNWVMGNPFRRGDQLTIDAMHTRGVDFIRAAMSAPVGDQGLQLSGFASTMRYAVVAPELVNLDSQGNASTAGASLEYPLIRARAGNLYLQGKVERLSFENRASGTVQSDYVIYQRQVTLRGNRFDAQGSSQFSLTRATGKPAIAFGSSVPEGRYHLWDFSAQRVQQLSGGMTGTLRASAQFSDDDLDSSRNVSLGGDSGVRAYPTGESSGEQGRQLTLELAKPLPNGLRLTGFYDWGDVLDRDDGLNHHIKGVGLKLDWLAPDGLRVSATLARRQGGNPNPTNDGNDQDGSLKNNRVWLSVIRSF